MPRGNILTVLLAVTALVLALIYGSFNWKSLAYRADMFEEAGKVAAALFVVAAFLERAMAVVNDLLFSAETAAVKNQLRYASLSGPAAETTAQAQLNVLEEKKQRLRLAGSFLVAVLIAAAGARTLSELLVLTATNNQVALTGAQLQLFRTMDILLTAGLLAGGSNGIAAIIDLIKKQVETSKAKKEVELAQSRRDALIAPPRSWLPARHALSPFAGSGGTLDDRSRAWSSHDGEGDKGGSGPDDELAFGEWLGVNQMAGPSLDVHLTARPWRPALSLEKLKRQLNAAFPTRSRQSDGTIGNEAHCAGGGGGGSDHCANIRDGSKWVVTAFDATHDPVDGCDMEVITQAVVASRDPRIKYIIWNRRICASYPVGSYAPWTWRAYSGANPHDKHAHFSVAADKTRYDDERDWIIA